MATARHGKVALSTRVGISVLTLRFFRIGPSPAYIVWLKKHMLKFASDRNLFYVVHAFFVTAKYAQKVRNSIFWKDLFAHPLPILE